MLPTCKEQLAVTQMNHKETLHLLASIAPQYDQVILRSTPARRKVSSRSEPALSTAFLQLPDDPGC